MNVGIQSTHGDYDSIICMGMPVMNIWGKQTQVWSKLEHCMGV